MLSLTLAAALCASSTFSSATEDLDFRPATGSLTLELDEEGRPVTMAALVARYAELTGETFTYAGDVKSLLHGYVVPIGAPVVVPVEEVPSFFEAMLVASDFVLRRVKKDGRTVIGIKSLTTASRNGVLADALYISSDRLEIAEQHPAYLFMTTVSLPGVDTRQLTNSLRTLITDANTMRLMPLGNEEAVLIAGFGPYVASVARMLREAADAERKAERAALAFDLVTLETASAAEVAAWIAALIPEARVTRDPASGAHTDLDGPRGPGAPPSTGRPAGSSLPPGADDTSRSTVTLLAIERNNTILVRGSPGVVSEVVRMAKRLDVALMVPDRRAEDG